MGLGLSASTGYKPFLPLLIISIASQLGFIELASHSQWLSSTLFICIMIALSILEFFSAAFPFLGRIFEIVGIPITLICGYIAITSLTGTLGENNIIVKHLIGILLGGGTAAIVKAFSLIKNALSDAFSFGLSSSVNSVIDSILAIFVSIVAIVAPLLVCILLAVLLFITYKIIKRLKGLKYANKIRNSHG